MLRVELARLRTQVATLKQLADKMGDSVAAAPTVAGEFAKTENPIVYNAWLLRRRNKAGLSALQAMIKRLEQTCRDLDTSAEKAGYLLASADADAADGITRGAGG
ncbi:MAG: hypothetical protein ACRDT6_27465 [Micromonosporaceae bacterium]